MLILSEDCIYVCKSFFAEISIEKTIAVIAITQTITAPDGKSSRADAINPPR